MTGFREGKLTHIIKEERKMKLDDKELLALFERNLDRAVEIEKNDCINTATYLTKKCLEYVEEDRQSKIQSSPVTPEDQIPSKEYLDGQLFGSILPEGWKDYIRKQTKTQNKKTDKDSEEEKEGEDGSNLRDWINNRPSISPDIIKKLRGVCNNDTLQDTLNLMNKINEEMNQDLERLRKKIQSNKDQNND